MTMPPLPPIDSGYAQQGRMPKNNGLAIAGFVSSLICCAPVGLGLSIAGLMQINKDPQYQLGKGFAIAGIVLGAVGIVAGILYWGAIIAVLGSSDY